MTVSLSLTIFGDVMEKYLLCCGCSEHDRYRPRTLYLQLAIMKGKRVPLAEANVMAVSDITTNDLQARLRA